jgi:hypothetical protein
MWALLLTLAAAPEVAARPDGVTSGALVQVVLGQGTVTIRSATLQFPAKRGMQLVGSDTVVVAPNGWVVLSVLGNGHVVRLDDDLELRVDQLAVLKAAKQTRDLEAQLNALLTASERESAQRLIGWNASPTAANVPTGVKTEDESGGGGSDQQKKNQVKSEEGFLKRNDSAKKSPPRDEKGLAASPSPAPPGSPVVASATPSLVSDAALDTCVSGSVKPLGAEVVKALRGQLTLRVKQREGKPFVQLPFGLPTPPCALKWFEAKPLRPEWVNVTVTIK